ncbi:MAG TPA: 2-oxoglutarate dehydrogenase complex dihydrolipoyllysine-residue succinyltransferase [Nitrososphaerales archaeon]|nr:2-oxoglutarate dehydrogenase complex dihydrolipoyllysine-residue succinyltransferase [Nitrososphaerales archaeon]
MAIEIKVPEMGESIVEATVGAWVKNEGDQIEAGETILELETEKVNLEVTAPATGTLETVNIPEGEIVNVGTVLGTINTESIEKIQIQDNTSDSKKELELPNNTKTETQAEKSEDKDVNITPVAKNLADKHSINIDSINGSGRAGKITIDDINSEINKNNQINTSNDELPVPQESLETKKRITKRRETIAKRLTDAHLNTVMTTTYNEVDMSEIMAIRSKYKDSFKEEKGVGLGFMSFFVKSVVQALIDFPNLNSEMQEKEIILKNYYHVGIAVASEEGLVVPVLKNANTLSFSQIEKSIADMVTKTKTKTLTIDDLTGGTFTITNGGVFGSMFSTPILNHPQVGILGMHTIKKKPVVINDEIVIRPIMYLALTYDHRIVDGGEAVQFLVRIKEFIEDPQKLLIEN